jgi:hypothetical protein
MAAMGIQGVNYKEMTLHSSGPGKAKLTVKCGDEMKTHELEFEWVEDNDVPAEGHTFVPKIS